MLTRQKTILLLLAEIDRAVTRTELVKLMFLLREETLIGDDHSYYQFVPYRFGPFSFALYRELGALERNGYVWLTERRVGLRKDTPNDAARTIGQTPAPRRRAIEAIVTKYGDMKQDALLKDVYERFPWFATKTELRELVPQPLQSVPTAPIAIYTVGYQGKSVDGFFNDLLQYGIQAILDVRANPISRKYGFAKKSMSEIALRLGVDYHHLPNLGIPSEKRANLSDFASYQRLLSEYEKEHLPSQNQTIQSLIGFLNSKPSALLCAEKDVRWCHRGQLAAAAARETDLDVVHL